MPPRIIWKSTKISALLSGQTLQNTWRLIAVAPLTHFICVWNKPKIPALTLLQERPSWARSCMCGPNMILPPNVTQDCTQNAWTVTHRRRETKWLFSSRHLGWILAGTQPHPFSAAEVQRQWHESLAQVKKNYMRLPPAALPPSHIYRIKPLHFPYFQFLPFPPPLPCRCCSAQMDS